MKFPRNARIFRGQLDATPFASVLFLLLMFLLLAAHVYKPGLQVELPGASDLPGTDRATVSVALDATGRLFYQDQPVSEAQLTERLRTAVTQAGKPLTLIVQADKQATHERLVRLALLAREAGIYDAVWATLPRMVDAPSSTP